jgi:DNA (cytosine-5)-methyltransferase 1
VKPLRVGSLCTGYGGLDVAVQAVIGGEHAWMAENDPHAAAVLAHHWPTVPNLGDITTVDWVAVEPVEIVVAGFPCTNISNAGPRDGINGKASRVWKNVAESIRVLRPRLVVLENVTAIRSRGLDVVAAGLAAIGYDAVWGCLRASGVGAPHPRDRWFCLAYPAAQDAHGPAWQQWGAPAAGEAQGGRARADAGGRGGVPAAPVGLTLLPTPTARDWKSGASNLLDVNSRPLNEFVVNRLPGRSWVATDGADYGPAIRRWEAITGHPAPEPTESGDRGNRRLSPLFAEWMMGLPPGHVTAVPGLTRNAQIRIIGGGVVPLQGIAAIESLMAELERRAAA